MHPLLTSNQELVLQRSGDSLVSVLVVAEGQTATFVFYSSGSGGSGDGGSVQGLVLVARKAAAQAGLLLLIGKSTVYVETSL